jgi:hypothetical protein
VHRPAPIPLSLARNSRKAHPRGLASPDAPARTPPDLSTQGLLSHSTTLGVNADWIASVGKVPLCGVVGGDTAACLQSHRISLHPSSVILTAGQASTHIRRGRRTYATSHARSRSTIHGEALTSSPLTRGKALLWRFAASR